MKMSKLERALELILDTNEKELDCAECFDLVSDYVDREIAGAAAAEQMPALKQHLMHCKVCNEEYEMLRDLARLEADGKLPDVDRP